MKWILCYSSLILSLLNQKIFQSSMKYLAISCDKQGNDIRFLKGDLKEINDMVFKVKHPESGDLLPKIQKYVEPRKSKRYESQDTK